MPVHLKQFVKYPNAGDVASQLLVSAVLNDEVIVHGEEVLEVPHLIAVGSILHWSDSASIIWGSGLISSDQGLRNRPMHVAAVRGPLTSARLAAMGVSAPSVFGDPGILISDHVPYRGTFRSGVALVPHYVDIRHPFVEHATERGAVLINPLSCLDGYLEKLAACAVVLSSSLHGLIFAHSYGIPAAWVRLSDRLHGDGFKFFDYYSSIGFRRDDVRVFAPSDDMDAIVDGASLPRSEIDKDALVGALIASRHRLLEIQSGG